ncbi:MAG: virulence protein RhuM/Fic/DOC family protein [Fimbriimonadaceae bacterium]|nr:virulence protein RhuM/Fic/DOC family protein [Chitinophagales bacterium]
MNEIVIYKTPDNETQVEVKFEGETVWLNQAQLVELFNLSKANISEHLKSIFKSGELDNGATVRNFRTVRMEGKREITRDIEHYNLDVIISIGYRVNTKRGIQFRQWATQRLKDYLGKGYAVNQKRLEQLQQVVTIIQQSGNTDSLQLTEAKGLLEILSNYTQSFVLLNQYDSNNISTDKLNENITYEIKYNEAKAAIAELKKQLMAKKEAADLFGNEKDSGFNSSLQSIVQTFDGKFLYPSIEEQAANLLYFVIKNHSFNDGNKRIGAFLFVWFLEKNKHRFKKSGEVKINDNGLVALALLVAQSDPAEKELMIKLIINLIANQG